MITPTKLQSRINNLYSSYSDNFAGNKEYLKCISDIAGNRGLSHKKRVERINNWINKIGDCLNDFEKEYVSQLLRTNKNYIKETQKVKDSHEVRENIYHIRRVIRNNKLESYVNNAPDSKPMSLNERAIEKITNTPISYGTPKSLEEISNTSKVIKPDFETYSETKSEKSHGFWKRAGKALTKTLIYGAATGLIGLCAVSGIGNSNKSDVNKIDKTSAAKVINEDNRFETPKQDPANLAIIDSYANNSNDKDIQSRVVIITQDPNSPSDKDMPLKETMEMHGKENSIYIDECKVCTELGIEKQQYLKDKPWDYPERLDKRCKQLNEEGKHLEDAVTRVGWVAAVANDAIEGPVRGIAGLIGGLWGTGSRIIGNENDGFEKGWENGDKFGAYVMDGFYGGVTKTEFDGRLLSLDPEGAFDIVYNMEDTTWGGHAKLGQVIWWDFIAPFVANNNIGNGGNGHHALKPVIKPVEGVTGGRTGGVGLR